MAVSNNFWIIIFLISLLAKNSIAARKLNASQAFDETWNTAPDLENELEQKRTKSPSIGPSVSGHWSGWSEWSTCSRSCDGGIMQQIRRCSNQNGCRGESIRYRICNMQPCPDQQDFRAQQCTAFNDVPYDGTLYKWIPHYDYVEPCALTCRGYPAHLSEEIISEAENPGTDSEHYDEQSVVVQLSASVQDGTRCRSGSLDMCIKGKCQRVGCDLKIGSAKKIDSCGVCGGDGSSCSQALYYWDIAPMSPCSVICGGGYKMSQTVCKNRLSGNIVDDSLCNPTTRPEPTVELCNTHICPPAWIADDWSSCSRLCGTGYRERIVICAEENNGVRTRVAEMLCRFPKPPTQESCIIEECPKWDVEEWTPCSASCGPGVQLRSVECKSPDGSLSAKCDPVVKPISARQCSSDGSCNEDKISGGTIILGRSHDMIDHTAMGSDFDEEDEEEDDDEDESNSEISDRSEGVDDESEAMSYNDQAPLYLHQSMNILHQEEPIGPKVQSLTGSKSKMSHSDPVSTEPTFIKDNEFSPCSVTCGEGIRRRSYKCKIFLEYSRTFATVNDSLCEGQKPKDEVERCVEDPCMLPSHGYDDQFPRDSIKVGVSEPGKTYVWREQGYTSCSASCLGGVEELIINCVREDNGRVVSPFLCSPETKPEARVRTCNDRPCPPRWNYSDYTPCSKSCGIGIKTREVQCIHEVTRGGDNTMVVPNSMCPQPPPADRQYCNVLDCPVRWEVGEWSKCSHTCGYGIKERKVECKQIMAQEHKIERPETMCPSVRPPDKKPCNVKPCPPEDPKPIISITNTTHIQHDPRKSKITLKIGGAAVVFFGTQVKIKCPVKRYNRTKIKWSKDHKPLAKSRKFKISKKGALRILDITFRDAGVYSCHADLSSAEIQIEVKAKPGQPIEEQFGGQESERLVRERSGSEPLISADMTALDNVTNYLNGNRKKQQNARERNRRPKSHEVQNAELNLKQNEQTNLLPQGDDRPQASASSGGSRTHALLAMPYFQMLLSNLQYLWPFQKLRASSYGNRMLNDKVYKFEDLLDETKKEKSFLLQQQLLKNQQQLKQQTDFDEKHKILLKMTDSTEMKENSHNDNVNYNNIAQSTTGDTYHLVPHIAKFSPMNVNKNLLKEVPLNHFIYDWRTSEWSKCSQSCETGNRGLRSRNLTCIRKPQVSALPSIGGGPPLAISNKAFLSTETVVNNAYCEEFGLKMPSALEPCDTNECPRWVSEEWSPCQKSRCIGRNVAIQKRKIFCQYENGTESTNCRDYNKPIIRRECYNERCKGVWRVEPWTKCNAPCGRKGIKYRIIQCVWYGTRRPAGNACKNQARPAVMKVCKSESCFSRALNCKDKSRYCPNVYKMGLCRLHQYQEKCCNSCNFNMH